MWYWKQEYFFYQMKVDSKNKKRKSLTTPINVRLKHSESLKCGLTPQKKKKKTPHNLLCNTKYSCENDIRRQWKWFLSKKKKRTNGSQMLRFYNTFRDRFSMKELCPDVTSLKKDSCYCHNMLWYRSGVTYCLIVQPSIQDGLSHSIAVVKKKSIVSLARLATKK